MEHIETRDQLSKAVGSSGRRALRDLRLLWVIGMLTLVGVIMALVLEPRPTSEHAALEAGAADLADVHALDTESVLLLVRWASEPDFLSHAASQYGTGALSALTETRSLWRAFRERPAVLPDEEAERDAIEEHLDRAREVADGMLVDGELARMAEDPSVRGDLIATTVALTTERHDALAALEGRYRQALTASAQHLQDAEWELRDDVTTAVGAGVVILLAAYLVLDRSARQRSRTLCEVESLLVEEGERTSLEGQLGRALEMVDDEASAYQVLEASTGMVLEEGGAELLVADSSQAHLARVAITGDAVSCGVLTPADCPAVRRGQTQEFHDPTAIDTCPQVRIRGGDHVTTCVPFTVGGTNVGVLHVDTPEALPAATRTNVELVSRKTGERVSVARAFARTQDQARTDPLTGLLNRRSLEEQARDVVESGRPYAVVFADLDHFKTLNDVHGHDAGDRALRLFSRCLRDAVRPADAVARYGGEEFVLVLPDCDADGAAAVIARIRDALERALHDGSVPWFTASFGIVEAEGGPLISYVARADAALLAAKRAGRNRSVLWSSDLGEGRLPDAHDDTDPGLLPEAAALDGGSGSPHGTR